MRWCLFIYASCVSSASFIFLTAESLRCVFPFWCVAVAAECGRVFFFRIRGSVRFLQTALFVPSLFEKTTGANIPDLQLEE